MHAQYPLASEANLDGSRSLRLGRVQRARREHGVGAGRGPAEQVALAGPATELDQAAALLLGLDPLRRDREVERLGPAADIAQDREVVAVVAPAVEEGPVTTDEPPVG